MEMSGNTILVVGGTSGIGRMFAQRLHDLGNHVVVAGRREGLLAEVTEGRDRMIGMQVDLDEPASLIRLRDQVRERCPELNVLVANAGISSTEDLVGNWNLARSEAMVETNIVGTMRVVGTFLPDLTRRRDATIMVTTSNLGFMPKAIFPTYCATKAFLHSWLQSLRHQLWDVPVEVLELAPPYVRTELTGQQQTSDVRGMTVEEFVSEVMELLKAKDHPAGEILVERARPERMAERNGVYDAVYAAMNPS